MRRLVLLEENLCVCRLAPESALPQWALRENSFFSITKTADELSVVCPQNCVPPDVKFEGNFRCLKIEGPLDFSLVGVLAPLATLLAGAGISIFAISTYDTDYILFRESILSMALKVLEEAGYTVIPNQGESS